MKKLYDIYNTLFQSSGPQHWWPAESTFEMITGAILTQNTSWSNVERTIENLGLNLTPEFIVSCPEENLSLILKPTGFFRQKTARLKDLAKWYLKYDCNTALIKAEDPEKIRNELLALKGVGHETADSIMLYAFDKPYFVVDTYTKRVFTRLGFRLPETYDDIRQYFESRLPYKSALFNEFHALIVSLAKTYCKKHPVCTGCPLEQDCMKLMNKAF